jgi:hypothetical protein
MKQRFADVDFNGAGRAVMKEHGAKPFQPVSKIAHILKKFAHRALVRAAPRYGLGGYEVYALRRRAHKLSFSHLRDGSGANADSCRRDWLHTGGPVSHE